MQGRAERPFHGTNSLITDNFEWPINFKGFLPEPRGHARIGRRMTSHFADEAAGEMYCLPLLREFW